LPLLISLLFGYKEKTYVVTTNAENLQNRNQDKTRQVKTYKAKPRSDKTRQDRTKIDTIILRITKKNTNPLLLPLQSVTQGLD
jgi:hypothetical protein